MSCSDTPLTTTDALRRINQNLVGKFVGIKKYGKFLGREA